MDEPKRSYYAIIPGNVRYDSELTPNAKLLYGEITALCNEKGYCWAGNSYFADLYSVSKVSISKWINQLVQKGYISSQIEYNGGTKEILHRYLRIVNDPIKENFNTPQRKVNDPIKENFKDNNTSNNTFNNTKNNSANQDLLRVRFETLWQLYPNKKGKEQAFKAYKQAAKDKVSDDVIAEGIKRYSVEIQRSGTPAEYIKHGSTYFRNRHWTDVYEQSSRGITPEKSEEEKMLDELSRQRLEGVDIGDDDDFF